MMRAILVFFLLVLLIVPAISADEILYPSKAPDEWFACKGDDDCSVIQDRCESVSVNKSYSGKYRDYLRKRAVKLNYPFVIGCTPTPEKATCKKNRCEFLLDEERVKSLEGTVTEGSLKYIDRNPHSFPLKDSLRGEGPIEAKPAKAEIQMKTKESSQKNEER